MNPFLIKVCGLADAKSAIACVAAGADWIGLNFHPPSPRSILPEVGAEIVSALAGRGEPVGLFVDRPAVEVADVSNRIGLRTVQIHGDEPPEYIAELSRLLPPPRQIVRAFRLPDAASIGRMAAYLAAVEALGVALHAILVDAHVAGLAGGTGHSIPSEVLERLPGHPRLILAGGLTPENVADRVAKVRPWMVDVASGVESSPGVKDLSRVRHFVDAIRGTANSFP